MHRIIGSDAHGYYEYLPYFFIEKDIAHQGYAYKLDNGNTINKYTMGVALLESPFFLVAYAYDVWKNKSVNPYGALYGNAIALSTSFYLAISLILLFLLLQNIFNSTTSLITCCLIYFATNLYYYSCLEVGMSHAYSFFCFSVYVYSVFNFFKSPNFYRALSCAFFLALAVLIRPTSILLCLLILLYNVYTLQQLKDRVVWLFKTKYILFLFSIVGIIVFVPQMLYWKKVTGNFFVFSYGYNHETFSNWKNPKLILALFGTHSGWLPFTPIMIFFIIGMISLLIKKMYNGLAIFITFICILYTCSSWWVYNFSCAYGYRSFIEFYVLFSIPIASIIYYLLSKKKFFYVISIIVLGFFFVYTNISMINIYRFDSWFWCTDEFNHSEYIKVIKRIFYYRFI